MILKPRLVISAGMPAAGKTTNCEAIAKVVDNALYLDRDTIISGGFLYLNPAKGDGLLPFHHYVGDESFLETDTPFGPMIKMEWDKGYYYRHAEWPSRMAIGHQAAQSLRLGKVPIFDCFLAQDINNGTVEKFIKWEALVDYPIYLIYFKVSPNVCKERMRERAGTDEEAKKRTKILEESFEDELWKHTLTDEGEKFVQKTGIIIDTTNYSIEECAKKCIQYITS